MAEHHTTGYEKSDTNVSKIAVAILIPVFLIVLCLVGLDQWLKIESEKVYYNQVLNVQDDQYNTLARKASLQLKQYKVLDPKKDIVRIPIQRAMTLLVQEGRP